MFDVQEYNESIKLIKAKYGRVFCNTLLVGAELERLAVHSKTKLIVRNGEMFILEPYDDFCHMYFTVSAENAAERIKKFVGENCTVKYVFDILGRAKSVEHMSEKLGILGLKPYAEYNRFVLNKRKTLPGFYRNICYSRDITFGFAKPEEECRISEIFKESFDRYTSHIPFTVETVRKHIAKNEICCAYYKDVLAAAFCFERLDEKNIHLNAVASACEYDSLGLGMLLYEFVLDQFSADTSYVCWIEKNNNASIHMHDSFGFKKDDKMLFYIYAV